MLCSAVLVECFEYLDCLACFCCYVFSVFIVCEFGVRVSPSIFGLIFVGSGGLFWLKPVAMVLFMVCSAVLVKWLRLKPCCV